MAIQNNSKPVQTPAKPAAPTPAPTPALPKGTPDPETGEGMDVGTEATDVSAPARPMWIEICMSDGRKVRLDAPGLKVMSTGSVGCTVNGKAPAGVDLVFQVGCNLTLCNSKPDSDGDKHPGRARRLRARYGF